MRLNRRGRIYLKDIQRILAEVHGVSERQRVAPRRVRIVSVEAVAEKLLLPRVPSFKVLLARHRHRARDRPSERRPGPARLRRLARLYSGETSAPRPLTRREDTLPEETLYEEELLPVCGPALIAAHGSPRSPSELRHWPLPYDLGWESDRSYWFSRQGESTPTSPVPRASACTPCWSKPRRAGSAPPSDARY